MTVVVPALVHEYAPRGSARTLMECRDGEVLVSGPAGTGKSRACLEKLLVCALINGERRDANGSVIKRGFRGLIARKTGVTLTATTLVTWKEHVAVEAIRAGLCVYYGGSRQEPAQYRFLNGARIMLSGLDNPVKIMSSEFDLVYVGEATELVTNDWEFITTRLRNGAITFQQLIADCNPGPPTHWLKKRCDTGGARILYSAHWENPRYFEEVTPESPGYAIDKQAGVVEEHESVEYRPTPEGVTYLAKLKALTGVRKLRLFDGIWAAADGLVFENWNPEIHLVDRFVPPKDWPRLWSIDFGYTNPFCCQWWAIDPDGRGYLYREIYHTKLLVEDAARLILKQVTRARRGLTRAQNEVFRSDRSKALQEGLCEWTEPEPIKVVCDHDAEDRATLQRYLHRGTTAARKTVKPGLEKVDVRFRPAGDGKPRLFLMRGAVVKRDPELEAAGLPVCTEDEVGGYVWAPPKPDGTPKEEPVKQNDHGCDAMRYFVADRDLGLRIRDRDNLLEG